jgi:3-oxoacyl-ACP reductase-like protein
MAPVLMILGALVLTGCTAAPAPIAAEPTETATATPVEAAATSTPTESPDEVLAIGLTLTAAKTMCDSNGIDGFYSYRVLWVDGESTVEVIEDEIILTYGAEIGEGPGLPHRDESFRCSITREGAGGYYSKTALL